MGAEVADCGESMTVGELRVALEGVKDEAIVLVRVMITNDRKLEDGDLVIAPVYSASDASSVSCMDEPNLEFIIDAAEDEDDSVNH